MPPASSERVEARDDAAPGPLLPLWALLTIAVVLGANLLANWTTGITIELMRSVSPFALQVRAHDERMLLYYIPLAFIVPLAIGIAYLRPLIAYFRRGCPFPADFTVERRAISGPL